MRLLHLFNAKQLGGKEAFFIKLVKSFQKAGVKQYVLCSKSKYVKHFLKKLDIPFDIIRIKPSKKNLFAKLKLFKTAKKVNPNFIFSWGGEENKLAANTQIINISIIFDEIFSKNFDFTPYRNADYIISNSDQITEKIKKHNYTIKNIQQLPTIIEKEVPKTIDRSKFYIPKHKIFLFTFGHFISNKNFKSIFKSIASNTNLYIVVAGSGIQKKQIEREALEAGVKPRTRFIGWTENISDILSSADFYIYPNIFDTVGNSLLEAMQYQIPIIAFKTEASQKFIQHNKNGILIDKREAYKISTTIEELIKNKEKYQELANCSNEEITEKFEAETIIPKYIDFLKSVFNNYTKRNNLLTD